MINKSYSYENIELFQQDTWKDRLSIICPLLTWIGKKNNTLIRDKAKLGIYNDRTDGVFDFKTKSVVYKDVVTYWDEKGLFYKCTEMGGVCWTAMIPQKVREGKEKNPTVMVVLHDADFTDQNWAMDTVKFYHEYNELASKEEMIVLYVVTDGPNGNLMAINILQELSVIFHFNSDKIFLDLSTVFLAGSKLSEISEFVYKDLNGNVVEDPDHAIEYFGNIPVLDISGRWQNRVSALSNLMLALSAYPTLGIDKIIHGACGREMAKGIELEYKYQDPMDPKLLKHWESRGLRYESHDKDGEQWITLAPLCAYEKSEEKLPVMLIFSEVGYVNSYQPMNALSAYYDYIDIAAQGEVMLLFFALETPDDNDLLYDILQDAAKIYPIDKSRVYVTGQSHNGHFTMEFMRRHHKDIAAVAPLSMSHGLPAPAYSREVLKVTDEMVDLMTTFDMPIININGCFENELVMFQADTEEYKNGVDALQRRLKACNCPEKSFEDIVAVQRGSNYAAKMIGVPNEKIEIQRKYGRECYIADIKNNDGKNHLRLVSIEGMPHMNAPQMPELSWDFVRRFARDLETGKVIELY